MNKQIMGFSDILKNKAILLLMLVVGLVYISPHLLFIHNLGDDYQRVFIMYSYDEESLLSGIKEIYDGNYRLANLFYYEHKRLGMRYDAILAFYLIGFLGKIMHLDMERLVIGMQFLFPMIIFLLSFYFLYIVTGSRMASILGSLITVFPIYNLINYRGFIPGILFFSRPIKPQFVYIPFLLFLLYFYKSIKNGKAAYTIISGFLLGVLFYMYFYFWTYLYVVVFLFSIFVLLVLKDKTTAKRIFQMVLISLCLSSGFWYIFFVLNRTDFYAVTAALGTHRPVITPFIILMFLFLGLIVWIAKKAKMDIKDAVFLFSLVLAGIVCMNQQILTGITVQPDHYEDRINVQMSVFVLSCIIFALFRNSRILSGIDDWLSSAKVRMTLGILLVFFVFVLNPNFISRSLSPDGILVYSTICIIRFLQALCILGGGLMFMFTFFRKKNTAQNIVSTFFLLTVVLIIGLGFIIETSFNYRHFEPRYRRYQRLAPSFRWLNDNTEPETVILAELNSTSKLIPIHTKNNVYVWPYSSGSVAALKNEICDRLARYGHFIGATSDEYSKMAERLWFLGAESIGPPPPYKKIEEMVVNYASSKQSDIYEELLKYRIDYVYYGPEERRAFRINPAMYMFLTKVYDDDSVQIFEITSQN